MAFRLVPRDAPVFTLLGVLAEAGLTASGELGSFLGLTPEERRGSLGRLVDVERDALRTRETLLEAVAAAFVVPLDRADVHALAVGLTESVSSCRRAAEIGAVSGAAAVPTSLTGIVRPIGRMAELTVAAIPRLRSPETLFDTCRELNRCGAEADRAHAQATGEVLASADPIEMMRLRAILDEVAGVARAQRDVARRIEAVFVKGR